MQLDRLGIPLESHNETAREPSREALQKVGEKEVFVS